MFTPKPHVSAALSQLRHSVTLASFALAACALVQLLVVGFAHFTDVRWELAKPRDLVRELSVVTPAEGATTAHPEAAHENGRKTMKLSDLEAEQNARVASRWDGVLRQFSDLAGIGGVACAVALAVLVLLGVVVAGGASVPGVEKTVKAATWVIVLAIACIPWRDVLASVPFAGVFGGYDDLTRASEALIAGRGSAASFYAAYLILPTAAIAIALLAGFRFREGVDRGIIVTSVSELDQALEQELADLRERGVTSHVGPRATGALHMAIGERPVAPVGRPMQVPALAVVGGPEPVRPRGLANDRRIGETDPGDPLKRPI